MKDSTIYLRKALQVIVCKTIFSAVFIISGALTGGCASTPAAADPASAPTPVSPAVSKPASTITIAAVGDIMLGGTAGPELQQLGYDYPFVYMKPLWADSALVFGNLEGPLTARTEGKAQKQYVFRSPPQRVAAALFAAGIRAVSLANNHTLDYGADGLADTVAALNATDIAHAGAGADSRAARTPAYVEANGKRIALLAYSATLPEEFFAGATTPGTAFAHEAHVSADVAAARARADIVLVSFHWGREGTTELRDYQTKLGRIAIDAGAHAVLGHHPHILQGIERYRDGIIFYSLGNFVFGSYSKTATRSMIAKLHFIVGEKSPGVRLGEVELLPINVDNVALNFQPVPLAGAQADEVIRTLAQLSQPLATQIRNDNGRGRIHLVP